MPGADDVSRWTDAYFNKSKATVSRYGDKTVTYALFMRRPVLCTPRLMIDWLRGIAAAPKPAEKQEEIGAMGD